MGEIKDEGCGVIRCPVCGEMVGIAEEDSHQCKTKWKARFYQKQRSIEKLMVRGSKISIARGFYVYRV